MPVVSRFLRIVSFALVAMVLSGSRSLEAQAPKSLEDDLRRMLGAVMTNSYDKFLSNADPTFRVSMNKELFAAARKGLEPRLKTGYDTAYLGSMKQQGFTIHLFKLSCKDKGDDFLVKMGIQTSGKVVGFTIE